MERGRLAAGEGRVHEGARAQERDPARRIDSWRKIAAVLSQQKAVAA
jgi:hypothetical protein